MQVDTEGRKLESGSFRSGKAIPDLGQEETT